jgi:hypothetical protein
MDQTQQLAALAKTVLETIERSLRPSQTEDEG